MKRIINVILIALLGLAFISASAEVNVPDVAAEQLTDWADGDSKTAFIEYLTDITDENSENYIPETDRIAVFDLDGTLCGEQFPIYFEWMMYVHRVLDDPDYIPTEQQIDVAAEVLIAARDKSIPAGLEAMEFMCGTEVYDGMTVEEYRQYVKTFMQTTVDRFDGLTLENAYFRTTVEAARFLQICGFTVYVVSGTDREADRMMIADVIGVPYRQIIGSDVRTVASGQGDEPYLEYQYTAEDVPMRTAEAIIKNVKSSKPAQMIQEIGQQPVVAFGNSTGDLSMFVYTTSNNPYRSIAFCVLPDDDEREVAYPEKAEQLSNLCTENSWYTISMKNDFVTIYGDGVKKNENSTPWLDEMFERLTAVQMQNAA